MYRYLLFCCLDYYPDGGMGDCVLKTNNYDELVPFIIENYTNDKWCDIHYYDTVEDKAMYALMDEVYEGDCFNRREFDHWSESES